MTPQTQSVGLRALWLRITALLCLLFCVTAAIGQACHTHRHTPVRNAHATVSALDRDTDRDEDSCPLCGCLHFTALVGRGSLPNGMAVLTTLIVPLHAHPPQRALPFHLSSRPPPIS